jgi:hypothetical protein
VGEAINIAGAEDEGAAELKGVAAEFVLVVAGGGGAFAALEIVAAEEVENIGRFQAGDFVRLAVFVDQQGKFDLCFFLKDAGVVGIAEADGGERDLFFAEGLLMFAQLRDMLAAEDSAVVAKEDEDGGIRFPERAETDLLAEGVGKSDASETLAEGFGHGGMI